MLMKSILLNTWKLNTKGIKKQQIKRRLLGVTIVEKPCGGDPGFKK